MLVFKKIIEGAAPMKKLWSWLKHIFRHKVGHKLHEKSCQSEAIKLRRNSMEQRKLFIKVFFTIWKICRQIQENRG